MWDTVTVISQFECEWTADRFIEAGDGVLYVTGWIPAHGPGMGGGYVCKSLNGGADWDLCPKIMRGDGVHSGRVYSILEDGFGTLYVGMQPAPDSVVFASSNGGESWYSTGGLAGTFECLCLLYASDGYIYAGTTPNGDVFKYRPQPTHVAEYPVSEPPKYTLSQSYPNPFHSATTIRFQVPEATRVRIKIYDVRGRCVDTLVDEECPAGWHDVLFAGIGQDLSELCSGIYFYRMETEHFTCVKKLLFLK
jgi:hypothetical protein